MPVLGIVAALLKNEVLGEAIGHLITLQEEMRHKYGKWPAAPRSPLSQAPAVKTLQ